MNKQQPVTRTASMYHQYFHRVRQANRRPLNPANSTLRCPGTGDLEPKAKIPPQLVPWMNEPLTINNMHGYELTVIE
jgi:hypothetical protein